MKRKTAVSTALWCFLAFNLNFASAQGIYSVSPTPGSVPQPSSVVTPITVDNTFSFDANVVIPPPQQQTILSGPPVGTPVPMAAMPAPGMDWQWTFLPQGILYGTYWASAAEPRMSVQVFEDLQNGASVDSYISGRFGIVRFGQRYGLEGFQLDLLGGAKLRQDLDYEMDVIGTDFRFDIPLTYRVGQHAWKFGYYHISAHAGDEFLKRNPDFERLNFLRDCLYLGYSYYPNPDLRLYAELDYGFNTDVAKPWNFQFGLDYGPSYPTRIYGAPFFAMNVHLRQELDYGGNINIQGGWAWRGEGLSAGTLRTGPFFYNGKSPQFSFYTRSEQQLGWGLWYDF
ncbi:DUF1207 domain-containing protein [Planctomicrobium sp. SH527]|uniref:DUF1207 domain-containing protein n=1 Tax=Planctomicrobium sp. SH527 TaxID=3448123 RepID=UPI003F5B3F5E